MSTTILDVAKLCGYSKATVSRAFIEPQKVNTKTLTKIYEAAKTLDYTPNAIARAMVTKKTENIAFIIYEKQKPVILNHFYGPILEAVLDVTNAHGYSLFIASDSDIRLPSGDIFLRKRMDGVIIAGHTDENMLLSFKKQNIPTVLLNNKLNFEENCSITVDDYGGSRQAVNHLISKGHRKIGILSGTFTQNIFTNRYNAYISTLKEHDIDPDYRFIKTIEPTIADAFQTTKAILTFEDRPTALFCTNDIIAAGAIKAIMHAGLRVPQDIAVIGFDDSDLCTLLTPELTSVHVDKEKMGKACANAILSLIDGKPLSQTDYVFETHLIVREST